MPAPLSYSLETPLRSPREPLPGVPVAAHRTRRNFRLFAEENGDLVFPGTSEVQLLVPFSGEAVRLRPPGEARQSDETLLQPKTAYLVAPDQVVRLDWHGPAEILVIRFGAKILDEAAQTLGFSAPPPLVGFKVADALIQSVAGMLRDLFALQRDLSPLVAISATSLLAIRVLSCARKTAANEKREQLSPTALNRAIRFVESHLEEDFGLDDMARSAGCSRFHFARAFKSRIGLSPWQYVTRCRLSRAETLLRTDRNLSVAEVCHAVGFQDQSHFTRAFKNAFSVTPGSFRRQA